jgi:hypothetical protein
MVNQIDAPKFKIISIRIIVYMQILLNWLTKIAFGFELTIKAKAIIVDLIDD